MTAGIPSTPPRTSPASLHRRARDPSPSGEPLGELRIGPPTIRDGVDMWRLARDSGVLDVNSRYAYLLLARDFAETSVVARAGGRALGFVTGYRRPAEPTTLLVWQVAVDGAAQGRGLAGRMLDYLVDRVAGVDHVETTITPSNLASIALFTGFARRRGAPVRVAELFGADLLSGDGVGEHEAEHRYRIGPIPPSAPAEAR